MIEILKRLYSFLKVAIPIILAVALVYTLFFKPIKEENNVANIISFDKVPSDTIRDDKGQLHAQNRIVYVPTFSLAEAVYKKDIDSLKKELKLKDDKILSLGTITLTKETDFKPSVKQDTNKVHYIIEYKNKWTNLKLSTDTSKFSKLITHDSLIFATIKQPYGFLKMKEKVYIDVKSANPDVKHIGVNYFQVEPPKNNKSKFGLGLGIGPGVSIYPEGGELKINPSWITVQAGIQYRF